MVIWFNATSPKLDDDYLWGTIGDVSSIRIEDSTNTYQATLKIANREIAIDSGIAPAYNAWVMLALVYNGTNITLYVNDTAYGFGSVGDTTTYWNTTTGSGSNVMSFGSSVHHDGGSKTMNDSIIDEIYMWNRSLTTADISNLWNNSFGNFYPFFTVVELDNCSVFSIKTINFTLRNESDDAIVNGDMNFLFDYGTANYTADVNNNNISSFCMAEVGEIVTDILVDYTVGDTTFSYFADDLLLTDTLQHITLYSTSGSTAVTFTVKDEFDNAVNGAKIKILKHDIATNTFKTIEIIKTNTDGIAVGNLLLATTWYKFIVSTGDGIVRLTTDPSKIYSTTKTFRIDLTASDWYANFDITTGINSELNYTASTNNFRFTWNDPTGSMSQGCLKVDKINRTIMTIICDNCTTSTAATVLCNIGANPQGRFIATGYFKFNPIYVSQIIEKLWGEGNFTALWDTTDVNQREYGVFLSFILILALAFIGIWSPVTAIIMTLVGFFIVSILGFLELQLGALIALIVLGGLVVYKVGRR